MYCFLTWRVNFNREDKSNPTISYLVWHTKGSSLWNCRWDIFGPGFRVTKKTCQKARDLAETFRSWISCHRKTWQKAHDLYQIVPSIRSRHILVGLSILNTAMQFWAPGRNTCSARTQAAWVMWWKCDIIFVSEKPESLVCRFVELFWWGVTKEVMFGNKVLHLDRIIPNTIMTAVVSSTWRPFFN